VTGLDADKLDGKDAADFLHNTGTLQAGAQFAVQSGSVAGALTVGGTVSGAGFSGWDTDDTDDVTVTTALVGDVTGTTGATVVGDDSHAHGDTTVANDISIANGRLFAPAGAGNVGIGTTSVGINTGGGLKIEQAGPATIRLEDTANTTGVEIYANGSGLNFENMNSSRSFLFKNGNVGIGTTAPGAPVQIRDVGFAPVTPHDTLLLGPAAASTTTALLISGGASAEGANLLFGAGTTRHAMGVQYIRASNLLHVGLPWSNAGGVNVDSAGNVGVGTATPGAKLHVAGNLKVDGNVTSVAWSAHDNAGDWCKNCSNTSADGDGSGSSKRIVMNVADVNVGSAYNPANGEVTAPTVGLYMICLNFLHGDQGDDYINFRIWINDTWPPFPSEHFLYDEVDYSGWRFMHACQMVPLNAGDRMIIQVHGSRGIYESTDENHERLYGWKL
jgi:hypothetical protein